MNIPPLVAEKTKSCHDLEWDPPHALSSARRWTCTNCGDAVLEYKGVVYGEATERTYEEAEAFWARLRSSSPHQNRSRGT